jgi:penicillin-binding protein 1C
MSARAAFLVTDILSDPEARAYAFGRGNDLEFPFAVAAKTGTSQAYHDNWTIGYTREVTVGVWVGNFDRTQLKNSSGVTGAGPIFHSVMLAATEGRETASAGPIVPRPDGLERTAICTLSGMRANPWCPSRSLEWTAADAEALPCAWHHQSDGQLVTIYPPEYRAWELSQQVPPATASGRPAPTAAADLAIANPPAGAIYSVDPTLRREFQSLPLRVVSPRTVPVTWLVDGSPVGQTSSDRALAWPLMVGAHEIEVRDADGRRARTSVVVK